LPTPPTSTLFPYTTLFRSNGLTAKEIAAETSLSAVTVRQYLRDIRESLHCPPRCKPPVIVHRLFTTQQVASPTAGRPAPSLTPEDRKSTRLNSSHVKTSYA